MILCSVEPRTTKYIKGYGFLSFPKNLFNKYETTIEYYCKSKTRCWKNCLQKLVHKTDDAIQYLIGNKIAEQIVKLKSVPIGNSKNVKKINIAREKMPKILK